MNWNKFYFLIFFSLFFSCKEIETDRFDGAQKVLAQYVDFSSIKDGERILFYSTYTGCESCRRMVKNEMDSLQFIPGLYIITNNRSTPIKSNKIYFDSLDLINHTNVGFSGPTILEKRGDKLVYLLEVTAQSKDSFDLLFNPSKK
jgi:hypothetical protein